MNGGSRGNLAKKKHTKNNPPKPEKDIKKRREQTRSVLCDQSIKANGSLILRTGEMQ